MSLILGSTYLLRGSFMPYHADALQRSWTEVDPALNGTPATPPWYGNATVCLVILVGGVADAPWRTSPA